MDFAAIQHFEKLFFDNFQQIKRSFREYKAKSSECTRTFKEFASQQHAQDLLSKFTLGLQDRSSDKRRDIGKRFREVEELTHQNLRLYDRSLLELKKEEIHRAFRRDNKRTLMDHYYPEEQMNMFRHRCETKLGGLKKDVEALDGKVGGLRHLIAEERAVEGKPRLHDCKDVMNEFTAFLAE